MSTNQEFEEAMRTIEYEDTGTGGLKPKSKGKAIGHLIMKPVNWISNSVKWSTNPTAKGGAQYMMKALAVGCFLLTTENTYQLFAGEKSVRFLPKPFVNDGADLSRVIPLGDVGNGILGTLTDGANLVGAKIKKPQPFHKTDFLIWGDPRFYCALVFALFLNGVEALLIRKVSLAVRQNQLRKSIATDEEIGSTVESFAQKAAEFRRLETHVRVAQVKNFGNGQLLTLGGLCGLSYLFEFYTFFATATAGVPFVGTLCLGIASVFGAEWLWMLSEYMETRDTDED